MKKRIVSALLAGIMVLSLAACGGGDKEAEGQYYNTYLSSDPSTMDPIKGNDNYSRSILTNIMEPLTRLEEEGDKQVRKGAGAETWEPNEDGTVWTFHLRDNKWSDGKEVTAADYAYGITQTLNPESGSPNAFYITCIKNGEAVYNGKADVSELGVKAVDEKTLEITLEYPVPYFISLTDTRAMYPVRQDLVEKYGESYGADAESMVGNGPFKMTTWKRNSEIILEKNENYWDAASVKLDKVDYAIVSDETSVYNSFDSGAYDYVGCGSEEWIGRFNKKDNVEVVEATTPVVRYDFFNCQDALFGNANIRKAFAMAINREDMCSVIYQDCHMPLYGWVPYAVSTGELGEYREQVEEPLKSVTEDPKELLLKGMEELGLGNDPSKLEVTYTLSATTEWTRNYASYCQQLWKENLGVNVELDFNEWGTFQEKTNNGEFQMGMMIWSIDYDDPMAMMEVFAGGSNMVPVFWQNEQYDSLVSQARQEMDETKRVDLYAQAEKILLTDECVVSPNVNECSHSYFYSYVKNYNKKATSTAGLKYVDTSER